MLLLLLGIFLYACGNEPAATAENETQTEESKPEPVRPDLDIRLIEHYSDSLRELAALEKKEKIYDDEPGIKMTKTGHFGTNENYYLEENNLTAFTNQYSSFYFRNGTLVHSNHRMLRKRCGGDDQICLTETRQYYKDQSLLWSETRYKKFTVQQSTDPLGLEAFQMIDTVDFQVIPNLTESTNLYASEIIMTRDILEELRQPMTSEEKMLKLE
jgi:hypothetical protein